MARLAGWIALAMSVAAPLGADAVLISVPADHGTIQAALDAATAGDTIEVDSGTYGEKLVFPRSGTAGLPITLRAKQGAASRPVIDGTGVSGANMVLIDSKSYVAIEGFEIRNNLGVNDGSGIRVRGAGTEIEIRDNVIHEMRGQHAMGITVYGTEPTPISALVIDGNEIYDCDPATSEALTLNGNVTNFEISNNIVRDVDNIGIDMIGGETDIQPNTSLVARNGVVRGNTVIRARSSYGGGFAAGIYVDGGRDIIIENNEITECDLGIEIGAENNGLITEQVVVRNNLVYRNDKAGIAFGGYASNAGRANDNTFRGNTLYDNNRVSTGEGEIWIQYGSSNVVENNLVVAGGPVGENVWIASFAGSTGNSFDYNLYYTLDGQPGELQRNDVAYSGLVAWQAGTGEDAHSLSVDPLLAAPGLSDFHLTVSSPAVGAGDPSYIPALGETDLDGATRRVGTAVDIGVDEMGCGDGVVDPGEQCDDSNLVSGDGCDENCTFTACGNAVLTPGTGEICDDGNLSDGDCCSSLCVFEIAGAACDDGRRCSSVDACDGAGGCVGAEIPDPICAPAGVRGASLSLRAGAKSRVSWRWGKGSAGSLDDLGDPTDADALTLCIYSSGVGGDAIVLEAVAPGGGGWSVKANGSYKYKAKDGFPDGLVAGQLRAGDPGKAKLKFKAKSAVFSLPSGGFGPGSALEAELKSTAGGCYGSTFSGPYKRDDGGQFKDSSD
jgi:cysteine-rich repeat protein